jgi:hypothetical protein
VDLMVGVQGYLVDPSATEAGGEYQGVDQSRIVDTRNGTGGVPTTAVPAGGSITFSATGVGDVPSTGATCPYPANGADPGEPGVNFNAADSQDNDMAAPLLSAVSPTGKETITNHSSGTVDVVVSVRRYYVTAIAPSAPGAVSASVSGFSVTVTWSLRRASGRISADWIGVNRNCHSLVFEVTCERCTSWLNAGNTPPNAKAK